MGERKGAGDGHAAHQSLLQSFEDKKPENIRAGGRQKLLRTKRALTLWAIVVMDSSGLDAVMGELVCALLRDLACTNPNSGRIVMAALHTPSSKVFQVRDHHSVDGQPSARLLGYGGSVCQYKATGCVD